MSNRASFGVSPSDCKQIADHPRHTNDELSTLLTSDTYTGLSSKERKFMFKLNQRFLQDPHFREWTRMYIEPRSYRKQLSVFPLLQIPTEIRLMIAKYALAYDRGLKWTWSMQPDGIRVGHFKIADSGFTATNPEAQVDCLCLSRQLRQETAGILLQVNDLHFFTDPTYEDFDDIREIPKFSYNTVRDFAFFSSRWQKDYLCRLSISIDIFLILDGDPALRELLALVRKLGHLKLRVIYIGWMMNIFGSRKRASHRFLKTGSDVQSKMNSVEDDGSGRTCRVFPNHISKKGLEILRSELSDMDYQIALNYIHKGI